jgi:hypothetical protein
MAIVQRRSASQENVSERLTVGKTCPHIFPTASDMYESRIAITLEKY